MRVGRVVDTIQLREHRLIRRSVPSVDSRVMQFDYTTLGWEVSFFSGRERGLYRKRICRLQKMCCLPPSWNIAIKFFISSAATRERRKVFVSTSANNAIALDAISPPEQNFWSNNQYDVTRVSSAKVFHVCNALEYHGFRWVGVLECLENHGLRKHHSVLSKKKSLILLVFRSSLISASVYRCD